MQETDPKELLLQPLTKGPEPLLKPAEVARRLSISRRTLHRITGHGRDQLRSVRVRKLHRYRPSDVEAFLVGGDVAKALAGEQEAMRNNKYNHPEGSDVDV